MDINIWRVAKSERMEHKFVKSKPFLANNRIMTWNRLLWHGPHEHTKTLVMKIQRLSLILFTQSHIILFVTIYFSKQRAVHSCPQRPCSFRIVPRITTSGPTQHLKSKIYRLHLKSDKSDWLRTWNKHSVYAKKVGSGQRLLFLMLTKRSAASRDKNEGCGYIGLCTLDQKLPSLSAAWLFMG